MDGLVPSVVVAVVEPIGFVAVEVGDVGGGHTVEHGYAVLLHGVAHEQVAQAIAHDLGVLDQRSRRGRGREAGQEIAVVAFADVVPAPPLDGVHVVGDLVPVVAQFFVGIHAVADPVARGKIGPG